MMKMKSLVCFLIGLSSAVCASELCVKNSTLSVVLNTETLSFRISGAVGVDGQFVEKNGSAEIQSVTSPLWGAGDRLVVRHPSGTENRITVFPELPFALFQTVWANTSDQVSTIKTVRTLRLSLDFKGIAVDALRLNGTCGLLPLEETPVGSYNYMAVADPVSRKGIVGGWLSVDRGSGVVFAEKTGTLPVLETQLDYGALRVEAGDCEKLEIFAVGSFADARIGLEQFADALATQYQIKLKPQPVVYCSWYHYWRGVTEKQFAENSVAAGALLYPYGLSVMQLDDGWQSGESVNKSPAKDFFHANSQFPNGMKSAADHAIKNGMTAGIWFMPFSGDHSTEWFADKQALFATKDGVPFNAKWGGNPLDMTNPESLDYLRTLGRLLSKEWGYKYFKIDGLWNGTATQQAYINTRYKEDQMGETKLFDPKKTHVEALRDGLNALRDAAGDEVYILGCCAPQNMRSFSGAFGLVDAMRIGPDNGTSYPGILRGPVFGGRYYFLHNRVWHNDPDPLYVRDSLPLTEAKMLASWVALSGQLNSSSEVYASLPPERLDLLRRTMPSHSLTPRPADYFSTPCPAVWLLTDDQSPTRRDVVGYFNWGNPNQVEAEKRNQDDDIEIASAKKKKKCPADIVVEPHDPVFEYALSRIGLDAGATYVGYEYWTDTFIDPFSEQLRMEVPERDCRIISVRPLSAAPQVLSTSRHITQGIMDLLEEQWNPVGATLSGLSVLVANAPYELRIATGTPEASRVCKNVSVSAADQAAGVTIQMVSQEGWRLKVLINSPAGKKVDWTVEFK
jgi:hypothetical protein